MKTKIILQTAMCAAIAGLAGAVNAAPIAYTTADNLIVSGTGNPVVVTANFISQSADDTDILELIGTVNDTDPASPAIGTPIFNNQTAHNGDSFNLGNFSPGTELLFEELVYDSRGNLLNTCNSGSDNSLNNDGLGFHFVHFDPTGTTTSGGVSTTTVGVEDSGLLGDYDYNDLVFSFTGVSTPAVPDVAGTMSLLGLGLTGLMAVGRRFRK